MVTLKGHKRGSPPPIRDTLDDPRISVCHVEWQAPMNTNRNPSSTYSPTNDVIDPAEYSLVPPSAPMADFKDVLYAEVPHGFGRGRND